MRTTKQINSIAYDLNITGSPVEEYLTKEEIYEYSYSSTKGEYMQIEYPQWLNQIIDNGYEEIIAKREELLETDIDPRFLTVLERAAYKDYINEHKQELYEETAPQEECIYQQAIEYQFDNYYYNVWLEQQSDEEVIEFDATA